MTVTTPDEVGPATWTEPADPDSSFATTGERIGLASAVAAAAGVGAGLVHAGASGSHNGTRTLAILFGLTAVAQIATAGAVALKGKRLALAAVALVNAGVVAAWGFTRVTGTELVAGLEERQDIGLADGTAVALEVIAVVAALIGLATLARSRPVRPALGALVGALALIAAVPAMAAPHEHTNHADATSVTAGGTEDAAHDGTADHGHDGAAAADVPAVNADPNVVLGIRLPQVDGVTDTQKLAAATLIRDTKDALGKFATVEAVLAAGFVSIGDAFTGHEHFVHRDYLANATTLDPNEPESLVFKVNADGTKTLASAMYILPPGKTMADVPDIAGAMTQWHDHQNLCWDDTGTRLAGVLRNGKCVPGGTFRPTPPMLHVWVTEHPCGPFAGIEGSAHTGACHTH